MDDDKLKILIIGGGGREHAVGWKVKQSLRAGDIFFAPGNAGTAKIGTNVDIKAADIPALLEFAKKESVGLTLALPDEPLALGIADEFRKAGLRIWGPTKASAELEWSKAFAKGFMARHNLPTAKFEVLSDIDSAKKYVEGEMLPIVIKASGLALGKGVVICETREDAYKTLEDIFIKKIFGSAGEKIVIEKFLAGPEISIHAFSDGKNYLMFPPAQDHKRALENDLGPNTGGMGTIAPLPFVSDAQLKEIEATIVAPVISGMAAEDRPFSGLIYPGLMLTKNGPQILEFNARLGDPETQVYMRLLDTDILDIFEACIDGKLNVMEIKWTNVFAANIVLASLGYPGNYEKGKVISGVEEAEAMSGIVVFHSGTAMAGSDLVTSGGRVLGVSAVGKTLAEALDRAYKAAEKISFEGMQYRKDIGKSALAMPK
ncbi:MAG: phosphoribosylamine--glycine ligase [bacterium]|nr:phosphoribosylamine--glycine ligase [bacterium]